VSHTDFFVIIFITTIIGYLVVRKLFRIKTTIFFAGLVGVLTGILAGAILAWPFTLIPHPYSRWIPWAISLITPLVFLEFFILKNAYLWSLFKKLVWGRIGSMWLFQPFNFPIIIDRETLEDIRFYRMTQAGFVYGHLLILKQDLDDLKMFLESESKAKRLMAARGLETYTTLHQTPRIILEIVDVPKDQLINLALRRGAKIMTVNNQLVKEGRAKNVTVLNINEIIS